MKTHNRLPLGKHLIVEMWGHSPPLLNSPDHVRACLVEAARCGEFTVIGVDVHAFAPHGVTAVALLAESHMSIHTWPEYGYAALDIFTCGGKPWAALTEIKERLEIDRVVVQELDRGIPGASPSGTAHSDWSREKAL